ncbi:MAG: membrane protein insertase YidC [Cytophagales bacterium]|nr:MAG: membrane protein insertase YidC [Rhodothermaeota bacterium MED-G16]
MDNNRFIGFTLIMLLILTYYTFFPPGQLQESENIPQINTQEELVNNDENEIKEEKKILNQEFSSSEKEQIISIENNILKVDFNTKGAKITNVILNDYYDSKNKNVELLNDSGNINFKIDGSDNLNLDNIIFFNTTSRSDEKNTITFNAISENGKKITVQYILKNDSYLIESKILLNDYFLGNESILLTWVNILKHQENNSTNEKNQTRINFFNADGDFDYTSATSTDKEEIKIEEKLKWISNKQQFFSSAILSNNTFNNSKLTSEYIEDVNLNKKFTIKTEIPIENNSITYQYYFGPNKYSILKNIENEFHNNLYLGWIGVGGFNRYIIVPVFNFLENITSNYGLIILIMVFLIRIVVTPLTFKSHLSMAKMKVLNPEIQSIRNKHEGDMQKSQSEIMELYQKTGVSPLGGCLPILFQLPILVSVFYFLPNAIELRGKSFLWATDLSNYDSILSLPFNIPFYGDHISLFTILMTVSTILINKANSQMQTMEGPMKTIQYILPIMFLFIFNNFSSGLTYYYFLSNVASYAQIFIFKRFVDDEKIKKEIEFNRKKSVNSKKSSFQLRIEEAMKAKQNRNKKKNK